MHEFSLAQDVLNIVLDSAREHALTVVTEVRLDVGQAAGVSIDALDFAWDYLRSTEKLTASAGLAINSVAAEGECTACGHNGVLNDWVRICPECGAPGFRLSRGAEFMVTGITGE